MTIDAGQVAQMQQEMEEAAKMDLPDEDDFWCEQRSRSHYMLKINDKEYRGLWAAGMMVMWWLDEWFSIDETFFSHLIVWLSDNTSVEITNNMIIWAREIFQKYKK